MCNRAEVLKKFVMAACAAPFTSVLPPSLHTQLLRDMQHWPLRSIKRDDLERSPESDTRALLGIFNGTVYWLRPNRAARNPLLYALVHDLVALAQQHVGIPNVVLSVNAFDEPVAPLRPRPMPTFSFFQTRAAADILIPDAYFGTLGFDQLSEPEIYRTKYPWERRRDCALWRGSLFCGPNRFLKCARLVLAHLSDQNASRHLDVRFTSYAARDDPFAKREEDASDLPAPARPLQIAPRVRIADHAACRYLIHLDGFTASSRLPLLYATTSVVLKMDSYFWSHFSSAFRPHEHYLPFWEHSPADIIPLLAEISKPQYSSAMRAIGERASALSRRILSRRARGLYWLTLLSLYERRLQRSYLSLEHWPRAKRVTKHGSRHAPQLRADSCSNPRTRRADEAAVSRLANYLDRKLAARITEHRARRPATFRAIPEGGDASLPLDFESDAERQALPPELDHAHLNTHQPLHRATWPSPHSMRARLPRERGAQSESRAGAAGIDKEKI